MEAPKPTSPSSAQPSHSSGPSNWMTDLKEAVTMKPGSYLRIAKNSAYFPIALGILALGQVATVIQQYYNMQKMATMFSAYGVNMDLGMGDFIKQGLLGFAMGLAMAVVLYYVALKVFKAKEAFDVKGFITVMGFISAPLILGFIPIVNILAGIYVLVLFFVMMKHLMGFGFFKALGAALLSGLLVAVVVVPLAGLLGLGGFNTVSDFSFDYSY